MRISKNRFKIKFQSQKEEKENLKPLKLKLLQFPIIKIIKDESKARERKVIPVSLEQWANEFQYGYISWDPDLGVNKFISIA